MGHTLVFFEDGDPIHAGHGNIQGDQVGLQFNIFADSLFAVCGLTHYFEIILGENISDHHTHKGCIIYNKDAILGPILSPVLVLD